MKTKTKTPPGDFPNFTGIYFGEYSLCFLIIGKDPTTKSCKFEVKRLNDWAPCGNHPANVWVSVKWMEVVVRS